jgi:hypothetical protein
MEEITLRKLYMKKSNIEHDLNYYIGVTQYGRCVKRKLEEGLISTIDKIENMINK